MSYNEYQFKLEVLTAAQRFYNLMELKFNAWLNDAPPATARTDYLNALGPRYRDPEAGINRVTVSSMSSATAWAVYKKSNEQAGDMFMGRLDDTGKLYERFGLGSKTDAIYNLTAGKPINVQKLKDWTVLINDCWMLGAIHQHRTFHLVSKISTVQDIWNPKGYFIVTGRELLGLMSFGYKSVKRGGKVSFVCADTAKANSATLSQYATLTNSAATSNFDKTRISLFAQGIS